MTANPGPFSLTSTYRRLRSDASIEPLAVDADFGNKLASGRLGNFHHEYLVTTHEFNANWPHWEMHPKGAVCRMLFITAGEGTQHRPCTVA